MNLKWLLLLVVSGGALFGSDGVTDIIPRTVNFIIFVAIIYYLLADFTKSFFKKRRDGIASKLNSVQEKVKESKKKIEEATLKLKEAKRVAEDIIATSKKEALIISGNFDKSLKFDLEILEKQHQEQIELESRKMKRVVVTEVLKEMFEDGGIAINEKEFVNIILKRVS